MATVAKNKRQHATYVLLDQRLFSLSAQDHATFVEILDNPPPPSARLKKLFASRSPWEK